MSEVEDTMPRVRACGDWFCVLRAALVLWRLGVRDANLFV